MLHFLDRPQIMGIVNLTPDSFYAQSRMTHGKALLHAVEHMLAEGADFIDMGGYSSRPGAEDISEMEERKRVIPAVRSVIAHFPEALISVDTFRSSIAIEACGEGAVMINDISGGKLDPAMFETVARIKVPYIVMHMVGDPRTMRLHTHYANIFKDIVMYFSERISELHKFGISDIILDPGFGFSKSLDQNYELLKNLTYFDMLGFPLLVGVSRKSMINNILEVQPSEALNGTTVLNTVALIKKASILRVHDVKETKQILKLLDKLEL